MSSSSAGEQRLAYYSTSRRETCTRRCRKTARSGSDAPECARVKTSDDALRILIQRFRFLWHGYTQPKMRSPAWTQPPLRQADSADATSAQMLTLIVRACRVACRPAGPARTWRAKVAGSRSRGRASAEGRCGRPAGRRPAEVPAGAPRCLSKGPAASAMRAKGAGACPHGQAALHLKDVTRTWTECRRQSARRGAGLSRVKWVQRERRWATAERAVLKARLGAQRRVWVGAAPALLRADSAAQDAVR
jgi:hypothetical protein